MPAKKIEDYPALFYQSQMSDGMKFELAEFRIVGSLFEPVQLKEGQPYSFYNVAGEKLGDYPPELLPVAFKHYTGVLEIMTGPGTLMVLRVPDPVIPQACPHCKKAL